MISNRWFECAGDVHRCAAVGKAAWDQATPRWAVFERRWKVLVILPRYGKPSAFPSMPERTAATTIRPFHSADEASVVALWQSCGLVRAWNNPHQDIARKLRVNPEWFLVAEEAGRIVGSVMVGYEGHRGWINDLAVDPMGRRDGIGRALMEEAESILYAVGCPKISLQVRRSNPEVITFYEKLGFAPGDVVSLGKRLEHD